METKLTDFTHEELKCLWVNLAYLMRTSKNLTDREREILQLWQVQVMNAANKRRKIEKVASKLTLT